MTCEDFTPFVDAYVDQELDEQDVAEMEAHLAQCDECRQEVAAQVRFKEGFKALLSQDTAPESLRERIFAGLDDIELELPEEPVASNSDVVSLAEAKKRRTRPAWIALPIAAAAALLFVVVPNFTVAPSGADPLPVVEQTVDWHRGDFPIEVTGPEAAEVSQWFRGKVGFPVRPPAFGDMPVNLLGGRIAHVKEQRAAYLLYEYNGTPVSVMAFDGKGLSVPSDKVRKVGNRDVAIWNQAGYEVAVIRDAGVTYTFTSALPEDEFISVLESSLKQ